MSTQTASHELATLQPVQRRLLWTLGLGAFGLAFSITTISVALPPLLNAFTNSGSMIGLVIGAEGFFALTLSPIVGPWSDSFHTPLGRRRPFMLVALGPMAFCLLLIPFMPNLWTTTLLVLAFYFAYYLYEPPYRGLYPDVLPPSAYGRAQGVQHVLRGIALGIALVGGNFLLKVWSPAPFLTAAFVTTAACGVTILLVREDGGHGRVFEGFLAYIRRSWNIFWQEGDVRRFLIANSAWEGTFAAARSFVILYVIDGLHESKTVSGEILGAVAFGYVIAAVFAGRLGDRFGIARRPGIHRCARTERVERALRLLELIGLAREHAHARAGDGEALRDRTSDPPRPAGDERGFAVETERLRRIDHGAVTSTNLSGPRFGSTPPRARRARAGSGGRRRGCRPRSRRRARTARGRPPRRCGPWARPRPPWPNRAAGSGPRSPG